MFKIIGFIITFCILAIPFSASAKSCHCNNNGIITASATGTVKIKPDGSRLYISIKVFNKSHKIAYADLLNNALEITNHFKRLNMVIYPKSQIAYLIKTTQINIFPNKIFKKGNWIRNGYNATENLNIKIHGNKNTNNAVLYLLRHKSVEINRITPTVSNMEQFKIKVVKLAYKHAILKIKAVLKLIGVKSYIVNTVDIKSVTQRIFPVPAMMLQAKIIKPNNKVYFSGKNKITADVFIKVRYNNGN